MMIGEGSQPMRKVSSLNVLFIGNSFTARNDLPGLVAQLAAAGGRELTHRLINVGGASLRTHWNKGDAVAAMKRERFDFVVLQEQSTLPIKNAARMHENVRLFDTAIRDAGARTALYLTWARQHAPQTQAAITEAYASIAEEIGALVIPAGVAWQTALRSAKGVTLYDKDGSHPTLAGSYLAACVMYARLFRAAIPAKAKIEGLAPTDADALRAAANAVVY
jgi:hypothetical protein